MSSENLANLVQQYRKDSESVYNTWFIDNETRMKAFRSIRRGVINVIAAIKDGSFGNDFKGSPLEFVLNCITEQKQVFEGLLIRFTGSPSCEYLIFMRMKRTNSTLLSF
ncbi:hypothetical protein [Desulfitobacterium sp.]|uniref:hypothetical protein n=1 Tax=Desulfitobacterium sp. TaxID=49981 RepID=UPI002C56D2CA|nr:hypothetical protein [Desulfitobacterium sp.]HVJ50633.1 hypothetical protein [Desulfitobacterium sp.]